MRIDPGAAAASSLAQAHARLRDASQQLEGVFLLQLLQAMRASNAAVGVGDDNAGEQMFTSMLDEHLAMQAAARSTHGIGESLYRQLARRLPPLTTASSSTETP